MSLTKHIALCRFCILLVCLHRLLQGVADMSIESSATTAATVSASVETGYTSATVAMSSNNTSSNSAALQDAVNSVQPVMAAMAT
jgi:hypothetical protein